MRLSFRLAVLSFACCFSLSLSAAGASFTNLVVFGDSVSDTGNLLDKLGGVGPGPQQNYALGLLTDGPNTTPSSQITGVWDQQLAQILGVTGPLASMSGGTNYAFAGAQTGSGSVGLTLDGVTVQVPNLGTQVSSFLSAAGTASPGNLYAIWGGSNDILDNFDAFASDPSSANAQALAATPLTLIQNEVANIQSLYAAGGREFLFFDVPDLGAVPEALALPSSAQMSLTGLSAETEQDFLAAVAQLRAADPGITIIPVDAFALYQTVGASFAALGPNNPYGLTNITTPAQGMSGVNPDQYLYWDALHPTTKGHQIIADAAEESILANTPEPSTWALAGSAILFGLMIKRRRSGRAYSDSRADLT